MSIYVQLTDKCNMSCAHCAFSCTGKGSFMTREVFEKCMEVATEYGWDMTLGGGEPTLHPQCVQWAADAAVALVDVSIDMDGPAVSIITNGKRGEIAKKLAKMNRLGIIHAELSQDEFHDPIDAKTVEMFKRYARIRNVTGTYGDAPVINAGRASEECCNTREGCACPSLLVTPNGDLYGCGCKVKRIGNILTDRIPASYLANPGECCRVSEKVPA